MRVSEARVLIENNQDLIGKIHEGTRVDDLIVIPHDDELHTSVIRDYSTYLDRDRILNSLNEDVEVEVFAILDQHRIMANGVLLKLSIDSLIRDLK